MIDLPKDVLTNKHDRLSAEAGRALELQPGHQADRNQLHQAVELMPNAKRPIVYTGGGVVNSGPTRRQQLTQLVR